MKQYEKGRACPKCGENDQMARYRKTTDTLIVRCTNCDYEEEFAPLDQGRQGAMTNKAPNIGG